MTDETRYVTNEDDLAAWRDAVWEGGHRSPVRTHLLLGLSTPQMLDRDEWVVVIDGDEWADAVGRSLGSVVKHRDTILASEYVEYDGQVKAETDRGTRELRAFRLVLPEESSRE